jgi:aryl-alcohol dehydrogenase-like predicted oxidoreductase
MSKPLAFRLVAVVLAGTTDVAHMRADLEVFEVRLGPEAAERIESLGLP